MARYDVLPGQFVCHTCKAEVPTIRFYPVLKELTWMCKDKHLSKVSLNTKKKKEDYEREIGE
jgi:hypothetical protein